MSEQMKRLREVNSDLLEALRRIEPLLDSLICFASDMGEHEANRFIAEVRIAISRAQGGE